MTDSEQNINQAIVELIDSRQSLELATASADGIPCASYAPFVCGEQLQLYVFLSDLAPHTSNIIKNPNVSAMIIEDESNCNNLFARHRLILNCQATRIDRDDQDFRRWIEKYKIRFGAIVDTLEQLADFNLYRLVPNQGHFVKGFGQAYQLSGSSMNQIKHIVNPAQELSQTKK